MQPTHLTPVYETEARIRHLAHLAHELKHPGHQWSHGRGRSRFTRVIDVIILWARRHVPALHWAGAATVAFLLYLYAQLVSATARLKISGATRWPALPAPGVLAIWHADAPSLLCAAMMEKPQAPLVIMISREPRGDCLAILCRLLGMHVVRGNGTEGGWEALAEIGAAIERGACAIITPDGGGPARMTKVGAVVLAAAIGAPLIAAGADCSPALDERHKWDKARNPVPFGRIAIALSEPLAMGELNSAAELERERSRLQQELDRTEMDARQALRNAST